MTVQEDIGDCIKVDSPVGRFYVGFDANGREVFFGILAGLVEQQKVIATCDTTVKLPKGWHTEKRNE